MDELLLKMNPDLARKYLEANCLYEVGDSQRKALKVIAELTGKSESNNGGICPEKVLVYIKFQCPKLVLNFINYLHGWFPKFSEELIFLADSEFLLAIYVFVVRHEDKGKKMIVTDFVRI